MQNIIENERFVIRAAKPDDLDALLHVEEEVFMDSWSRDSLSSLFDIERNVVLVACQNDVVKGYITGWHVHGEAEIARLGVLHEVRKQGIASGLITSLINEFDRIKVKKISLEVRVSNKAGFAIYHKFGFAVRGRRPRYYEDGEDALVMVKGEI
ncbi:MAG: ribosomal protein S18-alanine N-acetyltransferase [Abditibacteriaceae bacterium]